MLYQSFSTSFFIQASHFVQCTHDYVYFFYMSDFFLLASVRHIRVDTDIFVYICTGDLSCKAYCDGSFIVGTSFYHTLQFYRKMTLSIPLGRRRMEL